jgi:predicted permease
MSDPPTFRQPQGHPAQRRSATSSGSSRAESGDDPSTHPGSPRAQSRGDWTEHLRPRLAGLSLSASRKAEIIEELSQHLEQRYEELRADGATDAEARRLAVEELREPEALPQHMRALRQARVPPSITPGTPNRLLLNDLWQDLRYAARTLRKQPGFALAAVLTLALGIGANTAIFSLVNATLLQRLQVANRDRLVYVHRGDIGGVFSYPLYAALRDGNHMFEGFAAWGGIAASLNTGNTTDLVNGFIVTGNFFQVLGITADRGRLLSPSDDVTPGAHPVAVISHELWQTRFGGRPDIVGRDLRLNGHVFTIVGVTPAAFPGPRLGSARHLYVPMMMQAIMRPPGAGYSGEQDPDLLKDRRKRTDGAREFTPSWLFGVGRLRPGITAEQARAELATLATTYERTFDPSDPPERVALVPIDEGDPRQRQRLQGVALLLASVVAAVLLIACANIANLLLARAASRRRELAVRLAIGASRARLLRQLLTESLLLSSIGGAIGLGLAWAVLRSFRAAPPPPGALPLTVEFSIDQRVLLFSVVLSFLTAIVFGIVPALKASRPGLVPALKDASAGSDERGRRFSLQKTLVIAEVALSMLLLIPAGLFVRSLQAARAIDPGFDVEKVVAAPLNVNLLRYTRVKGREFYRQVVDRVKRLPGVEAASVGRVPVMAGRGRISGLMVEGRQGYPDEFVFGEGPGVATADPRRINTNVVGPGFFATLGIPLVSGRDFGEQDVEGRPLVAIVNETTVRMHFGGDNPLGRRVNLDGEQGPWREIVGVVRNSKYAALGEAPLAVAYIPVAQNHQPGMTLYVRAAVPPASLVGTLRREIQVLEPQLPVPDVLTMTETIGTSLYAARMGAWLLGAFGSLALLLAAVGIYGVLSFSISRRTREMGIRLALGAEARSVFVLVVRDGMLLVVAGVILGLTGALAGVRSLASFLYGVPTLDVATFAAMTTVLLAVALVACVIPARRAMRVNPIAALRYE